MKEPCMDQNHSEKTASEQETLEGKNDGSERKEAQNLDLSSRPDVAILDDDGEI